MNKNDIIEYVMNTPHNTNPAILGNMLNQLTEGGGSSDFSTAEVTISADFNGTAHVAYIHDGEMSEGIVGVGVEPKTIEVILYKGLAYFYSDSDPTYVVTGDITEDDGDVYISGNGTITMAQ